MPDKTAETPQPEQPGEVRLGYGEWIQAGQEMNLGEWSRIFDPPADTAQSMDRTLDYVQKYWPVAAETMDWHKQLMAGEIPTDQLMENYPLKKHILPEQWQQFAAQFEHRILELGAEKNPAIKFGLLVDKALKNEDPKVARFAQDASGWISKVTGYLSERTGKTTKE
jgi:hypothetical protein